LNYGVQAYTEGVLALAHFYPMLEVFDESGWNAEIPPPAGDVSYADASSFVVQIDAPAGLTIIGTGVETARSVVADRQVVEFAAGPARDFYLAASDQYMKSSQAAGNVALHFYAPAGRASGAARALEFAANAVAYFSERFGPYPYVELDLVATPNQALGIEYPGVIAIADRILDPQDERLEATVVHEVAHQWFYNLVGNDQLDQPWLDESFAQYATLEYFGHEYGEAGRQGFLQYLQARWESVGSPDMPVGLPVAAYTDQEYGAIVYGRGPLFIDTLREQIGDAAFERFLETYLVTFAWGIATEDGFKRAAQESCGCNLNALFETWVD
jgi:aminopeptidase N